ncbi:MAG TPA: ATP-binding protein [Thermodesulfobacteriota bacterium]|nr:ATP-binding protein [Thermodesulfobacteriota bacterium]
MAPDATTAKLWELTRLTRLLTTSLEYGRVLERVVEAARDLLEAHAAVLLIEGEDGRARVAASVGVEPERARAFAEPLYERIHERLAALFGLEPGDRVVGVPVIDCDVLRGVLAIHRRRPAAPLPDEEGLLSALADHAVIAMRNARLYEEAQAAVRAREAFLARASHELRTPLTSALGTVRLLLRGADPAGGLRPEELLRITDRNLQAMLALVNDLLDASKLASGRERLVLEPVEVGTVVGRSFEVVGAQAREKGVALRAEVPPGLRVVADAFKLEHVLVNLLVNAVKFTPGGGEVTVEAAAEGRDVLVRVRDTGQGIPREYLEAIFEPFFQVRGQGPPPAASRGPQVRGTGLGLAICRQIVTLHGGRIWAESEGPGRGSTFTVRLPAAPEGAASAAA